MSAGVPAGQPRGMHGTISVDHPAFRGAVAELHRAADRLRGDRDRVAREVGGLLDGAWSGAAATAFAAGWADWEQAATDVLGGLVAMGELLQAVHADLTEHDLVSEAHLDQVAARIVTRLG